MRKQAGTFRAYTFESNLGIQHSPLHMQDRHELVGYWGVAVATPLHYSVGDNTESVVRSLKRVKSQISDLALLK